MGHDGIRVGVQIIGKFVIKPTRLCYRSVCNHPALVGIFLVLLYLYRSFPLLFQLLVSASPVLVCTAVLLGTLLSFGDHNISILREEDEKKTSEIAELKTDVLGSRTVVARSLGEDSEYTELSSAVLERSFEEEPLLGIADEERNYECHDDFDINLLPSSDISREIELGKYSINEFGSVETGDAVDFVNQKTRNEVDVGLSNVILEKAHSENFEDCKSAEESIDGQKSNYFEDGTALERQMDGILRDFTVDNLEHHETDEKSPIGDRLESSTGSWMHFDGLEDEFSVKKINVDNFEDYISGEGSVDAQIGSPLELSLGSWNHLGSDQDVDDDSDSGSDGAESSSPDASMADIIPMLDELHPLLEDENPHTGNLSFEGSAHSEDESSDQHEEGEIGDIKSDGDDENEEENQGVKEDEAKSVINWTEEDQNNLMELGTSDLERNQRLESLIARRRARRMVSERNLLDLEGMDLSFPIAPITTTRYNPFENGHDSYGDLGLPPIPGSAPSVMVKRQNPFDLPYDSSEEKPDLTGDSFQEEFLEHSQRESANQRFFKRNETFSVGSSIFDFERHTTRASRFRPYFIPERTDSDVMSYSSFERQYSELSESRMSYSSLQRQSSGLSESKASSAADTDMTFTVGDHDERMLFEHDSGQGTKLIPEIGHPSEYVDGSQCSEDVHSISDEGNNAKEVDYNLPVATSYMFEIGHPAEMREDDKGIDHEVNYGQSEREVSPSRFQFVGESIEINLTASSSLSALRDVDDPKDKDDDPDRVNNPVHEPENVDISHMYSLETSLSDIPTDHSHKEPKSGLGIEADEHHSKDPVYDSSPLSMKRNPSSSSICSDLHRKTSDIDLYHVQRDLFAEEKSYIHDEDAEVTGHSSSSTGQNQQSSNSLESPMGEYDYHLYKDSSAIGLLETELLDEQIPLNEGEVPSKGHNFEGQHAGKVDTSRADIVFDDEYKSSIDSLVPTQEKHIHVLGDRFSSMDCNISSSEAELNEETETEISGNEHFPASTSSKNNHDNDASKEMIFALDEAHFLSPDSVIFDSRKQVQSAIHTNPVEFGQVNKVGETINVLKVQETEDNMLPSLLQNDESSSQLDKLDNISVSDLAVENHVQNLYETKSIPATDEHSDTIEGLDGSVADDLNMSDEINYSKEVDEELLSELDVVGDYSVSNVSLNMTSYLDDEVKSDIPVEVRDEVNFGDSTALVDITDAQKIESSSLIGDLNHVRGKLSISDAHVGDINGGLLVLEHQSSEEVQTFDAVKSAQAECVIVNEPSLSSSKESITDSHAGDANIDLLTDVEVQNSIAAEPIQVEDTNVNDLNLAWKKKSTPDSPIEKTDVALSAIEHKSVRDIDAGTMKELEAGYVKSELPIEATETITPVTKTMSLTETTTNEKVSISETSESSVLQEGQNFDSSRVEPKSGISVYTDISDMSGKNLEVLETTTEPEIVPQDSLSFHINSDIRHLRGSPAVETVLSPPADLGSQIEKSGSVVFQGLEPDINTKMMVTSPVPEVHTLNSVEPRHQMDMQKDGDFKMRPELPVLYSSNAHSVDFVDQRDTDAFVGSQPLTLDLDTHEIPKKPVEGSFQRTSEYEHQIEAEGSTECESQIDVGSKGMPEPILEATLASTTVSEDHRDIYSLMENLRAFHPKPENSVSNSGNSD